MISIILNGSIVGGREGMTILELAEENGIYIPTLCHDPHLKPVGACRVCLVEDESSGNLLASCVTPISSGMVINTDSQRVIEARRMNAELLLAGHPDSCIVCDKGNSCELRKVASELGIGHITFDRIRRYYPIETANPFIERNLSLCILCGKCVRACQEIEVIGAIDYSFRGFKAKPATALDLPLEQSICEFCGLCVAMCPVGALTDKLSRYKGKERESVRTTCPYCGCGCSIYLNIRDQEIISVSAASENSVNNVSLCVKGRYGYDFVRHPERLTTPLIRRNGELIEATWEEALDFVSSRINEIKQRHGSNSLAGLGSSRCMNEENYLFQKFFRAVLGSNNIDNLERLNMHPVVEGLEESLGVGANTNSIEELENSDVILVIGSDITESHPIIGQRIKRAVRQKGAKLIIVDPRKIKLNKFAELYLISKPGTDVALLNSLLNVIINQGLWDKRFVSQRTEGFERFKKHIQKYTPEYAEKITGVSAQDICLAAKLYAGAVRASIVSGTGITQHRNGKDIAQNLANLAMITGNLGKEASGIYYVLPQNNLQGVFDMGIVPDRLTGNQRFDDDGVKNRFEKQWNVKLPDKPGMNAIEIIRAIKGGSVKGLYVIGDNLLQGFADKNYISEILKSLDLLVVQDIFINETAELADVVLPASSFAEKDGTFTNTERRIQRVRKVIKPIGQSMPDWQIIASLSTKMGYSMNYDSAQQIMEEIAQLTPTYRGINYSRLEKEGLQWPCPDSNHLGTKFLYEDSFEGGKRRFKVVDYNPSKSPDTGYPFILLTGGALYHSGSGAMTQRSSLKEICPMFLIEINPEDAKELQIKDGDIVKITAFEGDMMARAKITPVVQPGTIFMPLSFKLFNAEASKKNILNRCKLEKIEKQEYSGQHVGK
ncbi:MAG: putative formate dehydrogenase [Actinobacteria bacterium]|nr:putative formate dehydrogenase [Actinomycetota bacterium]